MSEPDPDLYRRIVAHHSATRPRPVQHDDVQDVLRPESIDGETEVDYMDAPASDRGTGDGAIKEPKQPES